jgi:hypothetical protein
MVRGSPTYSGVIERKQTAATTTTEILTRSLDFKRKAS